MYKGLTIIFMVISMAVHSQPYETVRGNKDFIGSIKFSKSAITLGSVIFTSADASNSKTAYSWGNYKADTGSLLLTQAKAAILYMPKTTLNVYSKPQIDSISSTKAPLNSPAFTGTVTGITKSMVGLGNVTNESKVTMFTSPTFTGNVNLPATSYGTTATFGNSSTLLSTTAFVQTAIATKANLASPSFTGTPSLPTGTIAVTQPQGTSTPAPATTEYVQNELAVEISLQDALELLSGITPPQKTTTELSAITPTKEGTLYYDKTIKKYKYWNGTTWKTLAIE